MGLCKEMHTWKTVLFIVADVAGAGLLSLPHAVISTGFVLLIAIILISTYTGTLLGKSWTLLQDDETETVTEQGERETSFTTNYETPSQNRDQSQTTRSRYVQCPYVILGEKSFGTLGKHFTRISLNFSRLGKATVYLLLTAETTQSLIDNKIMTYCIWMCVLIPLFMMSAWLGRPKDFWSIALAGAVTSFVACVVLTVEIALNTDGDNCTDSNSGSCTSAICAISIMVFNTGGHAAFPTFQMDMSDQSKFHIAVIFAYIIILAIYFPVIVSSYIVIGSKTAGNILLTYGLKSGLTFAVKIAMALHFSVGFTVALNPSCQDMEYFLHISSDKFTIKRCAARSCLVALVLLIAEILPHFGLVMQLMGSFTYILLVFVCPPIIFMKIHYIRKQKWIEEEVNRGKTEQETRNTSISSHENTNERRKLLSNENRHNLKSSMKLLEKILCYLISLIGVILVVVCTVAAVKEIARSEIFVSSCFVNQSYYRYDIWDAHT